MVKEVRTSSFDINNIKTRVLENQPPLLTPSQAIEEKQGEKQQNNLKPSIQNRNKSSNSTWKTYIQTM